MSFLRRDECSRCWTHVLVSFLMVGLGLLGIVNGQTPPEEERENKPAVKKKIEILDDGTGGKLAPGESTSSRPQDLSAALQQATNPAVKKLYESLKVPYDKVYTRSNKEYHVVPLAAYVGKDPRSAIAENEIKFQPFKANWTADKEISLSPNAIDRVVAYEELALTEVKKFLDAHRTPRPGSLSEDEVIRAAETALQCVETTHQNMRRDKAREGSGWDEVQHALRVQRMELRLEMVDRRAEKKDWEGMASLAREMAEQFPRKEERLLLNSRLQGYVKRALASSSDQDQLRALVRPLHRLEDRYPDLQATAPIDDRFSKEAEELFQLGKKLIEEDKKLEEGMAKLQLALDLWARLPGLREYIAEKANKGALATLNVGVRQLPANMLPGLAATDADRMAIELILESLVQLRDSPRLGQYYVPQLVSTMPRIVPMGRQFEIPSDVYWPEGKWVKKSRPAEVADVRNSVRLLKHPRYPGYRPSWARMMDDVQQGADRRVPLTLNQGFLDPFEFMDFKILPRELSTDKLREFAQNPVGTGPYEFRGRVQKGDEMVRFVANPNYGSRAGKASLPWIHDIYFRVTTDPAADFKAGKIDLCPDVPTDQLAAVKAVPGVKLLPPLSTRRVYFLAVNHRITDLRNQDLRQAIALAINREEILTSEFRQGSKEKVHKALRGPYPADSWAYEPKPVKEGVDPLHNLIRAKDHLEKAKEDKSLRLEFDLLYPDDDKRVEKAMQRIASQLKDLGLRITPKPMSPSDLREAVETKQTYQLAFYAHDYPSEAYWLWPLFDIDPEAREPGACNYLGYQPESDLQQLFTAARLHRNFDDVKKATWMISNMLEQKMPLIPLWQLDRHIAYRSDIKFPGPSDHPMDPLLIFTDVEHWRKETPR